MSTLIEELKQKLDHLKVQLTLSRGCESHYNVEDLSNSIDILRNISDDLLKLDTKVINLKRNVLLLKENKTTRWVLFSVVTMVVCYLITNKTSIPLLWNIVNQ